VTGKSLVDIERARLADPIDAVRLLSFISRILMALEMNSVIRPDHGQPHAYSQRRHDDEVEARLRLDLADDALASSPRLRRTARDRLCLTVDDLRCDSVSLMEPHSQTCLNRFRQCEDEIGRASCRERV